MEKAVFSSPRVGQPDAGSPLLLLYARTDAEENVLRGWIEETGRVDTAAVHAGRDELAEWLAGHGDGDPDVVPVRVAWLPTERGGARRARLRDVLALRDPRQPTAAAQARITRKEPERYRVIAGEAARVSDLRQRHQGRNGESFETFVERQGVLALERAEREIIGGRYKVPRLVREDIVASARFAALVQRLAEEHERKPEEMGREAAAALDEMVASQSQLAIDAWDHFGQWVARAYTIDVDASRVDELRRLNRSHALVFLPSHRSYLDTLVLRPVLHRHGFPPNHVLGGSNLDFWPLGPVARRNGYVFIRRSMKDAPVYKAVLREYLGYLLRKRFNLEWYIEGGRTRTGKLRPPRYGILRYLVDAFRESGIDDVYLVPVAVVYDQLHEVAAMAAEEHGASKQAEGLGWIVNYVRAQRRPFGAVHLAFGEPLSLAAALREEDSSIPKIAFEVLNRVNGVTPITPAALASLALLDGRERAVTYDEGRALVRPLIEYVDARGLPKVEGIEIGKDTVFRPVLSTLVREGIVTEFAGGTEPVYQIAPDKHVEAAFYRNNAIHHFVTRAITELALLHVAEGDFADPADEVWQEALRLRDLLKFEFFFPRKRTFAEDVRAEMSILAADWEQRPAEREQIQTVLEGAPVLLAHRVLGSFVEAYTVVADRLAAGDPRLPVEEDTFVRECLGVGRQHLMQRRLKSPESLSRELFRGALRLAENRDLLDPGQDDLPRRRAALATEFHDVVRRVDVIRGWAHRAAQARA
ncbi:MAG: glycerol-3-phosphate 1-O-acyltransferase [Actinobacteria bacterium]|nr:MAG: glycerol-3-phosphate 1-O-acyltransferase [Actinomycetota bacterium]